MTDLFRTDRSIVLLTSQPTANYKAGDWMHARRLLQALTEIGVSVRHIIIKDASKTPELPDDAKLMAWQDVPKDVDVWYFVHAWGMPRDFMSHIAQQPADLPKCIAAHGIYWKSSSAQKVLNSNLKVSPKIRFKIWLKDKISLLGGKSRKLFGFDIVLCDSQAEVAVCKRDFAVSPGTIFAAIPNSVPSMPPEAFNVTPPPELEGKEYVLCPGIFAPRKNQINLIKAMKGTGIPVVFMGSSMDNAPGRFFYNQCIEAIGDDPNFIFVEKQAHGSERFYQLMRHARVVCLPSNCETPGIAAVESARLGARAVGPMEGALPEYMNFDGEYISDPLDPKHIKQVVMRAWSRGRMTDEESARIDRLNFETMAKLAMVNFNYILAAKN